MRRCCDKTSPFAMDLRPQCPRVGPDPLPRVRTGPVAVARPRPVRATQARLFLARTQRGHLGHAAPGEVEEYAARRSINTHGDTLHRGMKHIIISPTLWPLGKGLYSPHDAVYVSLSSGLACQNSRVANNAACAPGRTAALHTRPARRAVSNVHGYAHCTRGRHRAGTPHEGTMPLPGPGGEPCRLRHERHGGCRDQRTMNRVSVHIAINNGLT